MKSIALKMLLLPALLAVAACAGSPVIVASPNACSELLPDSWEKGVGQADIPAEAPPEPTTTEARLAHALDQLKQWIGFGVGSAAKVDQADGRYRDAIGIVRRCEERERKAVQGARPKFLGIL